MEGFNQDEFNKFVLDNDVVGFFKEPITLVSGRKSYFYFNWRNVLSDVWLTDKLTSFIINFIEDKKINVDTFYGVPEGATKLGIITQFKWSKEKFNFSKGSHSLAMGRGKPKEHGEAKDRLFLGTPEGNVVVIEDVTTTGGSLMKTLDKLRGAGANIVAVISLTNRMQKRDDGMSVKEAVELKGFKFHNMCSAINMLPEVYKKLQPEEEIVKALESEFEQYGVSELKLDKQLVIDVLLEKIDEKQTPCIIGLDPQLKFFPEYLKRACVAEHGNTFKAVAEAFIKFNKAIIDATYDLVPAYKLNMCFYEKYGEEGVRAFKETADYVKKKGCVVIEDAKRNEVFESAKAYAEGHLGEVEMCDGSKSPSLDVGIVVVNPYLGSDCLNPFIDVCKGYGKGIFILVKTSNPSSGELQDRFVEVNMDEKLELEKSGLNIDYKTELYNLVALRVNKFAQGLKGKKGYSLIGAVVGATYPEQAKALRKLMPNSFFLVPGYGVQGGSGKDIVNVFNDDGYGAVVNSSRGIIAAYKNLGFPEEKFAEASRQATIEMIEDVRENLKRVNKFPIKWRQLI